MKLTKAEKRIAILKDAFSQLVKGKFSGFIGQVVDYEIVDKAFDKHEEDNNFDAQKFLKQFQRKNTCGVCARGALLLSSIRKYNKCSVKAIISADNGNYDPLSETDKRLLKFFTEKQIAMMETAFEGNCVRNERVLSATEQTRSIYFGSGYTSGSKRLIAIFKNAIKNKGIFKP